jgi:hypothetical protein
MNPNPQFFQAFFGPQNAPVQQQIPEYIIHNETILEIINNWEFVQDLMGRHRAGKLQKVDQLEQMWYNFIISKSIDITLYKNEEEFLKAFWKNPDN